MAQRPSDSTVKGKNTASLPISIPYESSRYTNGPVPTAKLDNKIWRVDSDLDREALAAERRMIMLSAQEREREEAEAFRDARARLSVLPTTQQSKNQINTTQGSMNRSNTTQPGPSNMPTRTSDGSSRFPPR